MNLDELADKLHHGWKRYVELFGEPPHGTLRQIRAMLELCKLDVPRWTSSPTHGKNCKKVLHSKHRSGYLHASEDDSPYNVDGVAYCGRCYRAL